MALEACCSIQDLNLGDHYNASSVEKDDALKGGFGASKAHSDSFRGVKCAPNKSELRHKIEQLVMSDESDDSNGVSDVGMAHASEVVPVEQKASGDHHSDAFVPRKKSNYTDEEFEYWFGELYECGIQLRNWQTLVDLDDVALCHPSPGKDEPPHPKSLEDFEVISSDDDDDDDDDNDENENEVASKNSDDHADPVELCGC